MIEILLNLENDVEISYEFHNQNQDLKSIPVIFVNGSIFNFKQWLPAYLPAFKKLTNDNINYLLYDYEGIGLSSIKKTKFTIEQLVEELKQILDLLNLKKVHLFGVSKGTMVSLAFAGIYPEYVASVGGYGVVNIFSEPGDMEETRKAFEERLEAVNTFKNYFDTRINKEIYSPLLKKVYTPAIFEKEYEDLNLRQKLLFKYISRKVYPMLEETPVGTMALLFEYYVSDLTKEKEYFDKCLSNLKTIPILFMNGTIDRITPIGLVKKLVETHLQNASLVEFEGYGHIDPNLSKKKTSAIMDTYVTFLNNLEKS